MVKDMKKFLHRLFLPHLENNYRPQVLQNKVLFLLILFFFSSGFLIHLVKNNYPSVLGVSSDISNEQLLILTNQMRQENGLRPLSLNGELSAAASNKASNMFSKDYWAHIAPDGTTPWFFIKSSGYNYVYAGENLARGYSNATDVINAWMASPEHRKNMLSPNYNDVGFAVSSGKLTGEDTVLVVEMLGSTMLAQAPVNPQAKPAQEIASAGNPPINISPTPTITPTPTLAPVHEITTVAVQGNQTNKLTSLDQASNIKPLVNGLSLSIATARAVVSLFIFILILDMVIIERKKLVRFVGHNLDHIFFLTLILLVLLVLAKGVII